MKTVTERQLEVAVDALYKFNDDPAYVVAAKALAEIERIGKEGEVDAAIERVATSVTLCASAYIELSKYDISILIAEVRRLRERESLSLGNVIVRPPLEFDEE